MGVHGWTRFLNEEGWLPPRVYPCGCVTHLWRDDSISRISNLGEGEMKDYQEQREHQTSSEFASRIVTIRSAVNDHHHNHHSKKNMKNASTLHIDGYGLAFYIWEVAYERYIQSILGRSPCTVSVREAAAMMSKHASGTTEGADIQRLLPLMVPLSLINEVTREYMSELMSRFNVKVYFDGEGRRQIHTMNDEEGDENDDVYHRLMQQQKLSKQETTDMRMATIDDSWENLRLYCSYGAIPASKTLCQWRKEFPRPRLLLEQIHHTLRMLNVNIEVCVEECDHILARAASGDKNAYILGNDSDFCFFPDVNYIPFSTLNASSSSSFSKRAVTACVIRRDKLAESLGLPEEAMVELAILCGNDYLVDPTSSQLNVEWKELLIHSFSSSNHNYVQDCVDYLLQKFSPPMEESNSNAKEEDRSDYFCCRVTSDDPEVEEVLSFIRVLYNLGDLSMFPLILPTPLEDIDGSVPLDELAEATSQRSSIVTGSPTRRSWSSSKDGSKGVSARAQLESSKAWSLALAKVEPGRDSSVKDAVLRCLQDFVDKNKSSSSSTNAMQGLMTQEQLDAFRYFQVDMDYRKVQLMYENNNRTDNNKNGGNKKPLVSRQTWADNVAIYVITSVISATLKTSPNCLLTRLCSPASLFDFYQFHALLHSLRHEEKVRPSTNDLAVVEAANGSTKSTSESEPQGEPNGLSMKLPIDDYEETILERIRNSRVSIIQAGTGAGKSSRVPIMILNAPPPDKSLPVKMFISQPRRIAAKALVERVRVVEPKWKDCFALRMGHGVREYESNQTRAWFVTTGYLVRKLANNPEQFDKVSHLIIDEIHERSVETDLLCLLCRRLLHTNDRIRLVLMSATMAANLYQDYFNVPEPPLRVGARRFPVEEVFLDELESRFNFLPPKIKRNVKELIEFCNKMMCKQIPSMTYMEKLYPVVAHLTMMVGKPGTSVLVFVPGMNEIVALIEAIEQLYVDGIQYTCLPIHSDIPFEDQLDAFKPPGPHEVKVIIATNAAESSVTLPSVDSVVCTGLCKQIIYNELSHRQMLMPAWISKASATQRAGRTGRLRPGAVYRIYTRENYESHMMQFEPGEIARIPLDNVILMLKEMVTDDRVTDILLECLEPPNVSTIDRSFKSLHQAHFITSPDDDCEITKLGTFVSALGIDLALGSLIGLGIQMGVGAEAIQLAGVLSFPKTPWVITNPLIHEPTEYNVKTREAYISRCHFDSNLFSDPLATMNMLWEYEHKKDKDRWCFQYFLAHSRVKRLIGACNTLRRRVADFFEIDEKLLRVEQPPMVMPHSKLNILRVIQVWVFHDSLIECKPQKASSLSHKSVSLNLGKRSAKITKDHLDQVLCSKRHPFELTGLLKWEQTGKCSRPAGTNLTFEDREARLLSYAIEKEAQLIMYCDSDLTKILVYVLDDFWAAVESAPLRRVSDENMDTSFVTLEPATCARRGIGERACGQWKVRERSITASTLLPPSTHTFRCLSSDESRKATDGTTLRKRLVKIIFGFMETHSNARGLAFDVKRKSQKHVECRFSVTSFGVVDCVSPTNLADLFGGSALKLHKPREVSGAQVLVFPATHSVPITQSKAENDHSDTSWKRPVLLDCIPEGARLLSVLASGRRREHLLRLNALDEEKVDGVVGLDTSRTVDVYIDPGKTKLSGRWHRMNTDLAVYVNENCVPATALSMNSSDTLYCVAANTLEVRGGGLRVEGLTLLPPGRLFLILSRLSFGLFNEEHLNDNTLIKKSLRWVMNDSQETHDSDLMSSWQIRLQNAVDFHIDAISLGEELVCFPDVASRLVDVFNSVDGYSAPAWDIESNPFTRENLKKWKHVYAKSKLMLKLDSGIGIGSDMVPHDSLQIAASADEVKANDEQERCSEDEELREAMLIASATSHLDHEQTQEKPRRQRKRGKQTRKSKSSGQNAGTTNAQEGKKRNDQSG